MSVRTKAQYRLGIDEAALALEASSGDWDDAGRAASDASENAGLGPMSRRMRETVTAKAWRILSFYGWRPSDEFAFEGHRRERRLRGRRGSARGAGRTGSHQT